MKAIYKKELRSYFTSMTGYVFISFFLLIIGIYFKAFNLSGGLANFEYVLQSVTMVLLILVPILSMRLMAEERHQKTDQLLLTSPVKIPGIVIGKYLAVLSVFLIPMVVIMGYPLLLTKFGEVNLKIAYGAILGYFLLGAAYLAIGMFLSNLTESQVVSAVLCFGVLLITFLMPGIIGFFPADNKSAWMIFSVLFLLVCAIIYKMIQNSTAILILAVLGEVALTAAYMLKPEIYDGSVSKAFRLFSVVDRFDTFINGTLELTSIVYYGSIIFLFLFLTVQAIKKRRWS